MAKITLENGMVIEGTIGELIELSAKFNSEEIEASELKVGDYAKVVDGSGSRFEVGEITEVTSVDEFDPELPYRAKSAECNYETWMKPNQLVRATDEEVAQAKAEAEKWSAIGRKPNEFKVGDIVRGYSSVEIGEFSGSVEDIAKDLLGVRALVGGRYRGVENAELITPVEARFDRE